MAITEMFVWVCTASIEWFSLLPSVVKQIWLEWANQHTLMKQPNNQLVLNLVCQAKTIDTQNKCSVIAHHLNNIIVNKIETWDPTTTNIQVTSIVMCNYATNPGNTSHHSLFNERISVQMYWKDMKHTTTGMKCNVIDT